MTPKYISAALVLTLGAGCSFFSSQSSNYCEGAPNNNCMDLVDAAVDGPPTGCKVDPSKCTGATAVCDTAADVCVECLPSNAAACTGVEPVCGVDNSCRGCTVHTECASAVCLPDGSCAAESDVAYVDGTTGAGTTCTQAAPCKTVTLAMAPSVGKPLVKVTGTVREATIAFAGTTAKTLIGATGAKIEGTTGSQNLIELRDTAALTVRDLIVGGTAGNKPTACFALIAGTPSLTVTKGKIENCQAGIASSGGTVTVTGATVTANTGAGITATGGTVTVTGATVTANNGGGIAIANSTFKLMNNFIASNGNSDNVTGSSFGGVGLDSATLTNQFEQNTVVYNHQKVSALGAAGVNCLLSNFAAARNIISSNNAGLTFGPQTAGGCTFPASYVMPDGELNTLGFVNINTLNFHLTAASPATVRDVPGLTTCPGGDIDGDTRPINALCDLGADEFKP